MEEIEKEIRIEQSREHIGLDRRLFVMSSKEIFVDSKGKFAQGIHGFVGIFTKKYR